MIAGGQASDKRVGSASSMTISAPDIFKPKRPLVVGDAGGCGDDRRSRRGEGLTECVGLEVAEPLHPLTPPTPLPGLAAQGASAGPESMKGRPWCQQGTDGGLASTHRTDEVEVSHSGHLGSTLR